MATCGTCAHPVQMVRVGSELVAVEPEITRFVAASSTGRRASAAEVTMGSRVHSELCLTYKTQDEKAKLRKEMAAYNERQRSQPPARAGRRRAL